MNAVKLTCFLISAISSYAAFLYKLGHLRRSWRDFVYINLMVTLFLQCLTFSMGAAALSFGSLFGVRNLAILLMHLAAVAFCVSTQILLLQWAHTPAMVRPRLIGWIVAGVLLEGVLVALFVAARASEKPADDLATGSTSPLILTYLLIFVVSQAVPCVMIFRQCVPYARLTTNPWLRRSLRVLAAGALLLFLYCLARTVNILSPLFGADIGGWTLLASIFSSLGILTSSIGLAMPSWGPQVSKLPAWTRNLRSYRALHPLWDALHRAFPDIVLEPPGSGVSDLHYRLHRRVIEIRDGWRALRPYLDRSAEPQRATDPGHEHPDESSLALIEAAKIDRAIRAKRAGATPDKSLSTTRFDERDAEDLQAEIAWLERVSVAYEQISVKSTRR